MECSVGHMFDGVVSNTTKFGMSVELENTVEGLVHMTSLTDDCCHYDKMTKFLIGEHTARAYKMRQKVRVKCSGAGRFEREADFEVIEKKKRQRRKTSR